MIKNAGAFIGAPQNILLYLYLNMQYIKKNVKNASAFKQTSKQKTVLF